MQHITRYDAAKERMAPHLLLVMQELITLTNIAEVDDLADVMQELVSRYAWDVMYFFRLRLPLCQGESVGNWRTSSVV